jgi:hypothetical protein
MSSTSSGVGVVGDSSKASPTRWISLPTPASPRATAETRGCAPAHNVLPFDPVHCYGLPGYLQIIDRLGRIELPDVPGIGFELHDEAWQALRSLITPPD